MIKKINYKRQLKQEIYLRKVRKPILRIYKNSPRLSSTYCAVLFDGEKDLGYLIPGASFEVIKSYMPKNMEYVETGNDEYGLIGIFK